MTSRPSVVQLAQGVTIAVVMYVAIQIAFYLGIEEKSWFDRSWEILAGGGLGLIAGALFFSLVGAIGWVSGPLFGAVGLLGLATGGAVGGNGARLCLQCLTRSRALQHQFRYRLRHHPDWRIHRSVASRCCWSKTLIEHVVKVNETRALLQWA